MHLNQAKLCREMHHAATSAGTSMQKQQSMASTRALLHNESQALPKTPSPVKTRSKASRILPHDSETAGCVIGDMTVLDEPPEETDDEDTAMVLADHEDKSEDEDNDITLGGQLLDPNATKHGAANPVEETGGGTTN